MLLGIFLLAVICPRLHADVDAHLRLKRFYDELPNNPELYDLWKEHMWNYTRHTRADPAMPIPDFLCHQTHALGSHIPTSVHELHPANLKVIAAMGDSLTAGNGILADTILGDLIEYRGHSWCIGGEDSLLKGVLTLPNILKKYAMGIYGYSIGTGSVTSSNSFLNMAHPGDTAPKMPGQARDLVNKLLTDTNVDFYNDWKLVTLFIGGNDLCRYCLNTDKFSPENHVMHIRDALDILHVNVPKMFVNLVEIFDIAPLAAMTHGGVFCEAVHATVCSCGHDTNNAQLLGHITSRYQAEVEALIATGRYDTRDDFTVVLQPFFKNTKPPTDGGTGIADMSYFSPDCFHFSAKGHAAAALSLWNNMFQAVGTKRNEWSLNETLACPGDVGTHNHGFLTTAINSN